MNNFTPNNLTSKEKIVVLRRWVEANKRPTVKDIKLGDSISSNNDGETLKTPDLIVTFGDGSIIGVEISELCENHNNGNAFSKQNLRYDSSIPSSEIFGRSVESLVNRKIAENYNKNGLSEIILLVSNKNCLSQRDLAASETYANGPSLTDKNGTPISPVSQSQRFTTGLKSNVIDEAYLVYYFNGPKCGQLHLNLP